MLKPVHALLFLTCFYFLSVNHSAFAQVLNNSAQGVEPDTSVVIVKESEGGASIGVKNPAPYPVLLYSSLVNVPEDTAPLLIIVPPIIRVEPGESQLVRFILDSKEPLRTQRFKRVIFEGLPPKNKTGDNQISIGTRQNLPVLIHPKGLALDREPWKHLQWSLQNDQLKVSNDSPYVVRLAQSVQLMPSAESVELPRTYILAGEHLTIPIKANAARPTAVRLFPATVYGYLTKHYDAPLIAQPKLQPKAQGKP
jgi:P pilus assembly chaperone PapD